MRELRSERKGYTSSVRGKTEDPSGRESDNHHPHIPVEVPLPAKTKDRQENDGDDKEQISAEAFRPQTTSTSLQDPAVSPTFCPKDIDSWRRSVALKNSRTSVTSVASTIGHRSPSPQPTNATYSIDIEKQSLHPSSRLSQQTQPNSLVERGGPVCTSRREPLVDGREAKNHTPWLLLYLSFLSPPLTFSIAFYTLFILFLLLLLSPLSLCTKPKSLGQQIGFYLLSPLDYQFYCLYHAMRSELDCCDGTTNAAREHNTLWLIAICLLSPLYSLAIALAAWVAALFWIYAGILGDPNGSGQNDNDGPRAVLRVRKWWCEWLERAIQM